MPPTNLTSINCSLYLEGIEVPFNTVSINEQVNQPPTCTVTFPPQSGALKVLPGTLVQVFGERKIPNEPVESFLMFEGEAAGINYIKTADSRQAAIHAKSLINRWKQILKFAVDYLPQYTSQFAGAYLLKTSEMNPPGTDSVEASENTEKMEHSNILGIHQFFINAIKAYNLEPEVEGNTHTIFRELLKNFKKQSFYYGLMDQALDISNTFFGFPSQAGLIATKIETTNSQVIKQMIRGTNVLNFYDLLMLFGGYYNMSLTFPAAYTLSNSPDTAGKKVPMRGYFVPDLSYAVPIKSNIVFPTELHSVSTSRNFDAEPTALVSNLDRVTLAEGSESGMAASTLLPVYMSPGLALGKDSSKPPKPLLGFTPEETYRGRLHGGNINIPTFSELYMIGRAKKKLGIDGKPELTEDEKKELRETVDTMLIRYTDAEFLKRRYQARTCTAETDYNPYRIVGFPGLIFDYDGSPSIVGLLSGQNISINSEGRATSTLTFSSTRFVWDDTDFTALIDGESNSYPLYNLTNDVFPKLPMWYDENFYNYDNIGIELYPYVQKGKLADIPSAVKAQLFGADSQWYNWTPYKKATKKPTPLKDPTTGTEYNKNISPSVSEKTEFYDCSLMTFARDPNTGSLGFAVEVDDKLDSVKALSATIQAIRVLKTDFNSIKNKPQYIKTHNHRQLTSRDEYFKFLGVEVTTDTDGTTSYVPQYSKDYVDTDVEYTVAAAEAIVKADPPQDKTIPYGAVTDRPFSKKRADHVIEAFRAYLEDSTIKKNSVIVTR